MKKFGLAHPYQQQTSHGNCVFPPPAEVHVSVHQECTLPSCSSSLSVAYVFFCSHKLVDLAWHSRDLRKKSKWITIEMKRIQEYSRNLRFDESNTLSSFCNPKQTKSKSQRLAAGETGIRYADPSLEMIIRWVLLSQTQHLSFGILHEHQGKVILVVAKRRPTKVWRCRGLQCGKLNAKRCPIDNMEVFDIFCAKCNFNLKIDRKLNPDRHRFPQRHSLLARDQRCVPTMFELKFASFFCTNK